jgi:glutathione S-transferase
MITVHHLNNSRSQRVLWLLEELELPYEIVKYERDPKTMLAPASLRAVHPLGKSPVITDGDDGRRVRCDSRASSETSARAGHRSAPQARRPTGCIATSMHYAEGSLMPLALKLVFSSEADAPFWSEPIAPDDREHVTATSSIRTCRPHLAFLADTSASTRGSPASSPPPTSR